MRTHKASQHGFTLVELLVATFCMALVLAAVMHVFRAQSISTSAEEDVLDIQSNARAAMERIAYAVRHAGYGSRDSFLLGRTMTGNDPSANGTVTVNNFIWDIQDGDSNGTTLNPDSMVFVYGFRRRGLVTGGPYEETNENIGINTGAGGGPTLTPGGNDFRDYISFYPDLNGNVFYRVQNTDHDLDASVFDQQTGDSVFMVAPVRIRLNNGVLEFQNFAYQSGAVPSINWEIASGFVDLQFQYTMNGQDWFDVPSDPDEIIGVRVWLLAKTEDPDQKYTDTRTYTYAGQTVGPFNDSFHRILSEETVWLRNIE